MTLEAFWLDAWRLEEMLMGDPTDVDVELLGHLKNEPQLQAFLFAWNKHISPSWIEIFREQGLFDSAPPAQRLDEGFTARSWPMMSYLNSSAEANPTVVHEVLSQLQTDNWWVITDALKVALKLPDDRVRGLVPLLLRLWEEAPARWARDDLLTQVLLRLANDGSFSLFSRECVRVLSFLLGMDERRNDPYAIVAGLAEGVAPSDHGHVATAVEGVFQLRFGMSTEAPIHVVDFQPPSERYRSHQVLEYVLSVWDRCVSDEISHDQSSSQLRAQRLLVSKNPLLTAMGLRVVILLRQRHVGDSLVKALCDHLASDHSLITHPFLSSLAADAVSAGWALVDPEFQDARLVALEELASSTERSEQYFAQQWLFRLQTHLPKSLRRKLEVLNRALGQPDSRPGFRVGAMWVGPEGPLPEEGLDELLPDDLLPYLRYVPGPPEGAWVGSSPEGLAWQLPRIMSGRLEQFLPRLHEMATEVQYLSVAAGLVRAVSDGLRDEGLQQEEHARAVLDAFSQLVERVDRDELVADELGVVDSKSHVIGAVMDLVEAAASWLWPLMAGDPLIVGLIGRALSDSDPTPDNEAQFGGSNMDPPTFALNCTRGKAIRALLSLLEEVWKEGERVASSSDEVRGLLVSFIESEQSPSVRSVLGQYLPRFFYYEKDLWTSHRASILPASRERGKDWEAVFGTYLLYNSVYRPFVNEIKGDYELAVGRLTDDFSFLLANAEKLLIHHIVLLLNPDEGAEQWRDQFLSALGKAPIEPIGQAFWDLAHAYETKSVAAEAAWLMSFLRDVIPVLRQRAPESQVALTRLLDAALATNLPTSVIGAAVTDLIRQGAAPEGIRLLNYLRSAESEPSRMGALILSTTISSGQLDPYDISDDELGALLKNYTGVARREIEQAINQLGEQGRFALEPVARRILLTPER